MAANGVRFIRKNGRVIPVGGSGSAPKGKGISKRYGAKKQTTKPKTLGAGKGAAIGALAGAGAGLHRGGSIPGILAHAAFGAALGMAAGSLKFYKKGKGESNMQLGKRISKGKK